MSVKGIRFNGETIEIPTEYLKNVSVDGNTITFTNADGSTLTYEGSSVDIDALMTSLDNNYLSFTNNLQVLTEDQQALIRSKIGAGSGSFSGNYEDLANKPTIPSSTSQLTNDSGFITINDVPDIPDNLATKNDVSTAITGLASEVYVNTQISNLIDSAPDTLNTLNELAVAIQENDTLIDTLNSAIGTKANQTALDATNQTVSGLSTSVGNLETNKADKTELFSGSYNDLSNKPTLFSGSYNDLADKPTIPTEYVTRTTFKNQDVAGNAIPTLTTVDSNGFTKSVWFATNDFEYSVSSTQDTLEIGSLTLKNVAKTNVDNNFSTSQTITGNVTATTFNAKSDRRLKENIVDYRCEKSILDLPIKEFDYKKTGTHTIGCIAQDLQKICPEIVNTDKDGYLSIQEGKLVYLLLQEVKQLKAEIDKLKEV